MAERKPYGPFNRYISTIDRHLIPDHALGPDSHNLEFVTRTGTVKRCKGQAIVGDTHGAEAGLLESAWGARARQIISLSSPSMDDLLPTHACLYTREPDLVASPSDIGDGALYVRSTDSTDFNYVLGKEYGAFHYTTPAAGAAAAGTFHVTPIASQDETIGLHRLQSAARRHEISNIGRRALLEAGGWLYIEGYEPLKWNKRFNDSDSSGTEINRVRPWGHTVPVIVPQIPRTEYPARQGVDDPGSAWRWGDSFYRAIMFQDEDGSWGRPTLCREPRTDSGFYLTDMPDGYGFTVVEDDGVAPGDPENVYFKFLPWRYIQIGPKGTKARALLRSRKMPVTASEVPPLRDFFVTHVIQDNTLTSWDDYNGSDDALKDDPVNVRFDHIMAPRGTTVVANDSRVLVGGKAGISPCAIVLSPVTSQTDATGDSDYDLNVDEDSAALGSTEIFHWSTDGTSEFRLYKTVLSGPTTTNQLMVIVAGLTLGDLVDIINLTTSESAGGMWRAQLAPGVNGSLPAHNLRSATGAAVGDATTGVQVQCPAWPGYAFFDSAYLSEQGEDPQAVYFTGASPGHPQGAANSFYFGNGRKPLNRTDGRFMGAAPIDDMFVVLYEHAVYYLRNRRDGTTGEDIDFRMVVANPNRGCCAWDSIVAGDGWVGFLTVEGYAVIDANFREEIISRDVFDAAAGTGDWVGEVGSCAESSALYGDNEWFHAMLANGVLHVNYRDTSAVTVGTFPFRSMRYDYSESSVASGINELLDSNGRPLGWSPERRRQADQSCSVMGKLRRSSGLLLLTANDQNPGTNDGRIDQFDTGTTDNGDPIVAQPWSGAGIGLEILQQFQPKKLTFWYKKNGTGLSAKMYRDIARSELHSLGALPTSSTALYIRSIAELPQAARAHTDFFEWYLDDDGSSANGLELFRVLFEYELTAVED